MKKYISNDDIIFYSKVCNSVAELGYLLNCTGCNKGLRSGNLNGRDLRKIRKVLGLKKYAELSGNKTHGGKSFYSDLFKLSKKDAEIRELANKEIKKDGIVMSEFISNAVESYRELSRK